MAGADLQCFTADHRDESPWGTPSGLSGSLGA
jgi:hypothetical protein